MDALPYGKHMPKVPGLQQKQKHSVRELAYGYNIEGSLLMFCCWILRTFPNEPGADGM